MLSRTFWRELLLLAPFCLTSVVSLAQTLTVKPDRPESLYKTGETVRWIVESSDASKLTNPTYTVKRGGLVEVSSGKLTFTNNRALVESTLSSAGWLYLETKATSATSTALKADGGAMVNPEALAPGKARPSDFDSFWDAKLAALSTVPVKADITPGSSGRSDVDYGTIRIDGYNGTSVRGQWAKPKAPGKYPGLVVFQWAGVYSLDPSWVTGHASQGWLVLNTQPHDINPVDSAAYYTNLQNTTLKDYWRIGNESRDTSYFLRMYLACHRAVEYLSQRDDWDGKTLVVMGASQGGQQSIVAAALHPKVTGLLVAVPAGGDQDGVDVDRLPAFPQWAYQAWDRDLAKVREAGRYFDTVNFASRVQCPALLGVGLIDNVVPPASVYLAYERMQGPRRLISMATADHQNNQGEYNSWQTKWLADFKEGRQPVQASAPLSRFSPVVSGRPINLSVLGAAGIGDDTLIGGFTVMGSGKKTLLVRASGPALAAFGVPSQLADPLLRLYNDKSVLVAENDSWSMLDYPYMEAAHAFGWTPGSTDAALVVTLPAGSYTAQVVNRGTGAPSALMEVYDLSQEAEPYLYNVSCRIRQETTFPTIVGFTLDAAAPVLVRNGGPSLLTFNVTAAAADTSLAIYDGTTLAFQNDDWSPSLSATFSRLGAYGYSSSLKDSALLLENPPLQITAHARAVGTGGVGLVEAFLAK